MSFPLIPASALQHKFQEHWSRKGVLFTPSEAEVHTPFCESHDDTGRMRYAPTIMKSLNRHIRPLIAVLCLAIPAQAGPLYDDQLLNDVGLILNEATSHDDTVATLEAAALMRLVDSSCYTSAVIASARPESFLDRLRDCRLQHRRIWPEVERRIDYARAVCATPMYGYNPDVRWDLFLRYGPPTAEWSTPSDCTGRGHGECTTYIYSWHHLDKQVTCQSDRDFPYPVRVIEGDVGTDETRRPVYPIVQPLVFPSPDGTYDVWLTVWVRGGDFTKLSLLDGLTRFELRMTDADRRVVGADSLLADLRLLRSVLSVTNNKDAIMAMAYLSAPELRPGRYTAEVSINASHMNRGTHKTDVIIPSRYATDDLSDPVVITRRVPKGDEIQPGIIRGDANFYADPLHVCRQYDSLDIYHEFLVPQTDDAPAEFTLTVSAYPRGRLRKRRGDDVTVSPIIYIQDTLGNPWGSKPQSGTLPPPDIEQPVGMRRLHRETIQPSGDRYIFEHTVSTKTLSPDDYWLQISITDKDEQRFFRTALTAITVK